MGLWGSGGGVIAGGVVGAGEDSAEDSGEDSLDEHGADNSGVDSSGSSTSMASWFVSTFEDDLRELRVRLATTSEREDPEDSSNVRLGDRWIRRGVVGTSWTATGMVGIDWGSDCVRLSEEPGDGERDSGSGMCAGLGGRA